jgi:hypothetical protein
MKEKLVELKCCNCGEIIFTGKEYEYEYPLDSGNKKKTLTAIISTEQGNVFLAGKNIVELADSLKIMFVKIAGIRSVNNGIRRFC